ncbi:MAG: 4-hydroxy-3-methylbut-2-enyl diphosphate reductase, partial [Acidocella sp. 20-63-7]
MDGSQSPKTIRVILAQPRGFCAGVERAIDIVERALIKFGPPIYVRHEIVHNRHVVEDLRA